MLSVYWVSLCWMSLCWVSWRRLAPYSQTIGSLWDPPGQLSQLEKYSEHFRTTIFLYFCECIFHLSLTPNSNFYILANVFLCGLSSNLEKRQIHLESATIDQLRSIEWKVFFKEHKNMRKGFGKTDIYQHAVCQILTPHLNKCNIRFVQDFVNFSY